MSFTAEYTSVQPTRDEIDHLPGLAVLEFGTGWCGYCQSIQTDLERLLDGHTEVRHLKVEDGKGRPLGRSFRVKLWPTLVFLRDGQVVGQMSRPSVEEMRKGLEELTAKSA